MGYQYPLREDWSTEELITVITFFEHIEKAYETAVTSEDVLGAYKEFKKVVPAMAEEKRLFKEFEKSSTYNSYQVVQRAKRKSENITMS